MEESFIVSFIEPEDTTYSNIVHFIDKTTHIEYFVGNMIEKYLKNSEEEESTWKDKVSKKWIESFNKFSETNRISTEKNIFEKTLSASNTKVFFELLVKTGEVWKIKESSKIVINPSWTIDFMATLINTDPNKMIGINPGFKKLKVYYENFGLISREPLLSILGKTVEIKVKLEERSIFLNILNKMNIITKCKKKNLPVEIEDDIKKNAIK